MSSTPDSEPYEVATLRANLADVLPLPDTLSGNQWRQAFRTVSRHVFTPRFTVHDPQTGQFAEHDTTDPDPTRRAEALAAAYTNDTLITRWTDGIPTSSSTEPSLMAQMLDALDARPGHRVLEIGTGTGYNAALLCVVLGEDQVTTIDVDADLTEPARVRLDSANHHPTVLCADGAHGAPGRGPFDRILATCGMDRVPTTWISQLAPGGAILANVSKGIVLLRDVGCTTPGGGRAVAGRYLGGAGFMPLRSTAQGYRPRLPVADVLHATDGPGPDGSTPDATVIDHPELDSEFAVAAFLTGLLADRSQLVYTHAGAGPAGPASSHRWLDPATGSWARVDLPTDALQQDTLLYQGGPRRLWDELAPVLAAWHRFGRPDLTRWGLTVTEAGDHRLWLDSPDSPLSWELAAPGAVSRG